MSIRPLPNPSIHQISSGQVIPSLHSAVKELLENALDAGASSVEIRLGEWGTSIIEVLDDGVGLGADNLRDFGRRSWTSKLGSGSSEGEGWELDNVKSFGFRGEAINSLIAICERVSVSTATSSDAPLGFQIDDLGNHVSEHEPDAFDTQTLKRVARQVCLFLLLLLYYDLCDEIERNDNIATQPIPHTPRQTKGAPEEYKERIWQDTLAMQFVCPRTLFLSFLHAIRRCPFIYLQSNRKTVSV